MDSTKLPEVDPVLSISPARVEIVFAEDPSNPLAFISPPIDDINEMADLQRSAFSLKDHVAMSETFRQAAVQRLSELTAKAPRFDDSPTLHNRLANLFAAVGNTDAGQEESERAYKLNEIPFFARKVGEARTRSGDIQGAKQLFLKFHDIDSYASLRLASFSLIESRIGDAKKWVSRAVELNPAGYAERLFQGALSLVEGNFRGAVTYFRIALEDKPVSSVAYTNLGLAYLGLQRADKAMQALKRAVALDPFNRSALIALADTGSLLRKDEDVINSLRYFVQFEQKDSAIWGRLARSLLRLDLTDDCVHALKRQGALESSVAVWNNLGVVYAKQKQFSRSLKAFTHALSLESEGGVRQDLLVARNITVLISKGGQFQHVIDLISPLVMQDSEWLIAKDDRLSDLYSTYIHALSRLGRSEEAISFADRLLEVEGLSGPLAKWLVIFESAIYGLDRSADDKLEMLIDQYGLRLATRPREDIRLINNIAFALAELGRLTEASDWITKGSWAVHIDPYITATLGLINIRKGNLGRGEALYREAVSLATAVSDKARIRQKLNVELGRALWSTDKRRSLQLLAKAAEEKLGENVLRKQALTRLAEIKKLREMGSGKFI